MNPRAAWGISSLIVAIGLAVFYVHTDWYAFGEAVPPDEPELSATDLVRLDELLVNGQLATSNSLQVIAGEPLGFQGRLAVALNEWWWSPLFQGRSIREMQRQSESTSHLPRLNLQLMILAKSSHDPGYRDFSIAAARVRRRPPDHAAFFGKTMAPLRTGVYETRLVVTPRPVDEFAEPLGIEYIIGSFQIRVVSDESS